MREELGYELFNDPIAFFVLGNNGTNYLVSKHRLVPRTMRPLTVAS